MRNIFSFLGLNPDKIGIDLGTSNSVVAIVKDGKPYTIKNLEGQTTTPSIVAWTKSGDVLVGEPAARQAVTNPANTVYSIKRFIGTEFEERKKEAFSVPYTVRPGLDKKTTGVEIDGRMVSPEEISAEILGKLKAAAEEHLGRKVSKAVITVPAYFNERQRTATKDAARIAGLEVEAIINEPTAAALAYANDLDANKTIAVYDLGGGTFDFSILKITEETAEVVATGGNNHLGGDNIDEHMMTNLIGQFHTENGKDLTKEPQAMQRLKEAATKAKIELSSASSTEINLPFLTTDANGPLHLNSVITRDAFESDIAPIIAKTIEPMAKVLSEAGLGTDDIDDIILVGGSTRIPLVRKEVEKFFGKKPMSNVETDEIVAHGAAIRAAMTKGDVKKQLIDVCALNLGVEIVETNSKNEIVAEDLVKVLIAANTQLPHTYRHRFSTVADNQTEVVINCVQGNESKASKNKSLAEIELVEIPPAPAGTPEIYVTFSLDGEGILHVEAERDGKTQKIQVKEHGMLDRKEVEKKMKEQKLEPEQRKLLNAERKMLNETLKDAEKSMMALPEGSKGKDRLAVMIQEGKRDLQEEVKPKELALKSRKIQALADIKPKDEVVEK